MSGDGDKVLLTSEGLNGSAQLYLKSLSSGELTLVSNLDGEEGNGYSGTSAVSLAMVDLLHMKLGHRIC